MTIHTLIIGGGPAGSSCGIRLRQQGIDCIIVDKATFPRVKMCGGLLSWKGGQQLRSLLGNELASQAIDSAIKSRCETLSLYRSTQQLVTVNFAQEVERQHFAKGEDHHFCVVDRSLFDAWLIRHFQALGGQLIEGDALKTIDFDNKTATLQSGNVIHYTHLVACDGTNSHTLHLLRQHDTTFPTNGTKGLCIEMFVPSSSVNVKDITIHFDVVPNTYAYVFTKGQEACIGLGKMPDDTFNAKEHLLRFAHQLGVSQPEQYPIRGAMLPCYSHMLCPVWHEHLYLAGDAAGLVEMLTGEGISHALASGRQVAQSIATHNPNAYLRHIHHEHKLLRSMASYQHMLENPRLMRYFYRHVGQKASFVTYFYLNKIDRGRTTPFPLMVLQHKLLKLRNWLANR